MQGSDVQVRITLHSFSACTFAMSITAHWYSLCALSWLQHWRHKACGWHQWSWRSSWSVQWWRVGHCLWRCMGCCRCQCRVWTARLLQHRYVMYYTCCHCTQYYYDTLKVLSRELEHTLVKDLEAFYLIMLHVLVLRPGSLTVLIMALVSITVSTLKMLEWPVNLQEPPHHLVSMQNNIY